MKMKKILYEAQFIKPASYKSRNVIQARCEKIAAQLKKEHPEYNEVYVDLVVRDDKNYSIADRLFDRPGLKRALDEEDAVFCLRGFRKLCLHEEAMIAFLDMLIENGLTLCINNVPQRKKDGTWYTKKEKKYAIDRSHTLDHACREIETDIYIDYVSRVCDQYIDALTPMEFAWVIRRDPDGVPLLGLTSLHSIPPDAEINPLTDYMSNETRGITIANPEGYYDHWDELVCQQLIMFIQETPPEYSWMIYKIIMGHEDQTMY